LHNLKLDFILYFFQMFFAFEAVFLALVQPNLTIKLAMINELLSPIITSSESPNKKNNANGTFTTEIITTAVKWVNIFSIVNLFWRRATIAFLVLGIPVASLLYYYNTQKSINITDKCCIYSIYACFIYMFGKIIYYLIQFLANHRFLKNFQLMFAKIDISDDAKKYVEDIITNSRVSKNENSPSQATGYLKTKERPKGRGIKPKLRNK
jgi:hypothetical protein